MDNFIVTEVFGDTIQGEGKYLGQPSVFVRFFGCTLHCPGFSLPRGQKTTEVDEIVKTLSKYKNDELKKLPLVKTGCDSYPAWRKECKRFSKEYTVNELGKKILSLIPKTSEISDYHVVFTGGEPLLYQKPLIELMTALFTCGITNMTFETNGTVGLTTEFIRKINLLTNSGLNITWSCSPKLSISGHTEKETLFPERVASFNLVNNSYLYFKYVIRDEKDLKEVEKYNKAYIKEGVIFEETYLMPEGGTVCNETSLTEKEVVNLCIKYGYRFSPRLHLALFGNKWGK